MLKSKQLLLFALMLGISFFTFGFTENIHEISDLQIETASLERLRADTRLDARNVTVKSTQHAVVLGGTVSSLEDKFLAERIVGSTLTGIRSINNLISVVPTSMKDKEIEKEVLSALKNAVRLRDASIKAEVNKGIVRLTGEVNTYSHITEALDLVASIKGVVNVVSGLKLVTNPIPDERIAKEVATYLEWSPVIDSKQIHFIVKEGAVHLSGTVSQFTYINTLVQDLSDLSGVVSVIPDLNVQEIRE